MNLMLRSLWNRLLPPGGDIAVAKPIDDRETFIPSDRRLRVHWQGYRPEPRRLDYAWPEGPGDLSSDGRCWFWYGHAWVLDRPVPNRGLRRLWLPFTAIANPGAEL